MDSGLRRSSRESRPRKLLGQETDGQLGMNQPGLNHIRTSEERIQSAEAIEGLRIFNEHLRGKGWDFGHSDKLDFIEVYYDTRASIQNAVEGVSKFYSYDAIWRKWISDKEFRRMHSCRKGSCRRTISEQGVPDAPSPGYDNLGEPTLGVPAAAGRSTESTRESGAKETRATPGMKKKRGRPSGSSKQQKQQQSKKRQKKREPCSSPRPQTRSSPVAQQNQANSGAKTETPPTASSSTGALQLPNRSVVTPPLGRADLLDDYSHLADENAELKRRLEGKDARIDQLERELEDALDLAAAQAVQVEDLNHLGEKTAKEKVALKKELDQMRMNQVR
ncbi:unnamed protein product [Cylindrotheca closterium]|uniref:Uncharacterized protein n=1 Tax=Cylindrotheca closterium TaxID=2856 RepID=A0AAD2FXW0_9STRA|nr:unnamed protein product [Cylindrotheca closterium]